MMGSFVTIRSYSQLFLAELAQSYLDEYQISSEILANNTFIGCFPVELRVLESDFEKAEHFLTILEQESDDNTNG